MKIIQCLGSKESRPVTNADIPTVLKDAEKMRELCNQPLGPYPSAQALAHVQVEEDDPLRFYVTKDGDIIINPEIIRHTRHTVIHKEGCMSYVHREPITVERYNKIEIKCDVVQKFTTPIEECKLKNITLSLSSKDAFICQHEIDHFNGTTIYDQDGPQKEGGITRLK